MSILTYCLVQVIEERSQVPLKEAYEYVRVEVPAYVKQKFPNVVQTPVLIDNTTLPVYLRP